MHQKKGGWPLICRLCVTVGRDRDEIIIHNNYNNEQYQCWQTIGRANKIYRVRQIKVIPCRVLLISQQRRRIFTREFTQLFVIHIYV